MEAEDHSAADSTEPRDEVERVAVTATTQSGDDTNVQQATSSTSVSTTRIGATQASSSANISEEEINNASNASFETPDTSMAAEPSDSRPTAAVVPVEENSSTQNETQWIDSPSDSESDMDIEQPFFSDESSNQLGNPFLEDETHENNSDNGNDNENAENHNDNGNEGDMEIEPPFYSGESSNSIASLLSEESSESEEPEDSERNLARRLQHDVIAHIRSRVEQSQDGTAHNGFARLRRLAFRLNPNRHRNRLQEALRVTIEELGADANSDANQGPRHPQRGSRDAQVEGEEVEPENIICFDTNLPGEHSYLGPNMNRVCGVNYIEPGQQQTMLLFMHQHFLFPGEILPFMISDYVLGDDLEADTTNGLLFGVVFNFIDHEDLVFGVTCHIYEKGSDCTGHNILVKSRALQRFKAKKSSITGPLQYIAAHPTTRYYGRVTILPEIFLRDPLKCINMGSLYRFRENPSMQNIYRRYQAASTPWPSYVYDKYSIQEIIEVARTKLAQHKIDAMPTDPIQLSFWLVRNMHFTEAIMKEVFMTDSVNLRMKIMAGEFKDDAVFTCRYCGNCIADCKELFAMSKHGVQTQYCNSAGYIHETNTVYLLRPDAVMYSGAPSTEFSWFPGYQWHIINCSICQRHMGWEFQAVEANLMPKIFYGISGSSVRVSSKNEAAGADHQAYIYRSLMRLARREPAE